MGSLETNHEELCFLTGKWKIIQRTDSHRYSTDDVVTAWVAWRVTRFLGRPPISCCDIGTGIGSVLLMTAWLHPHAQCLGVEAQPTRLALAQRSALYNLGRESTRVRAIQGDLRDKTAIDTLLALNGGVGFPLVTGTPPYFNVAQGGTPPCEESARCLFEYRGGIEAYCGAASTLLAPGGVFCVCQTSLELKRSYAAAAACGLKVLARVDVVPVKHKPPLFFVLVCCLAASPPSKLLTGEAFSALLLPIVGGVNGGGGASSSLPYADMEGGAYLQWLEKEEKKEGGGKVGGEEKKEEEDDGTAAPPSLGTAHPTSAPRQRQAPRGEHVTHLGKPFEGGSEIVHVLYVRGGEGERTAEYRRLLWELGKPS